MEIKPKNVAVITYQLRIDPETVVDEAKEESPFAFIHGIGSTLEAFDKNLTGKKPGESFEFKLSVEEGYGPYIPENVISLPRENFEGAPAEVMQVGKTIPMQGPDNQPIFGTITEISDSSVKMDFNLPLAGKELFFSGKVLEVREATKVELEHGHVHGKHGHQH